MQLALVSDSHIPGRAESIPESFRELIRAADHVVHAGDFTSPAALADVRELAGELTAVEGNMDSSSLELPTVETLTVEDVTFVVTHGTGSVEGYETRVAGMVREHAGGDAIGVAGHTHEVADEYVEGVRLLNPGSVTGALPADRATLMTATVEGRTIEITVHEA